MNLLRNKISELDEIRENLYSANLSLEERVQERTKELEEAKSVLEIKVLAREEELKILTVNLEDQVLRRTKALEKKAEELQRANRSIIDRELKMVEIKRGIDNHKKM